MNKGSKKSCSVCNSTRAKLYSTGRLECNLWACLPCVKRCDFQFPCSGCGDVICFATATMGEEQLFCRNCHAGSVNLACHACDADIGYCDLVEKFRYNEAYCMDCIKKTKARK